MFQVLVVLGLLWIEKVALQTEVLSLREGLERLRLDRDERLKLMGE